MENNSEWVNVSEHMEQLGPYTIRPSSTRNWGRHNKATLAENYQVKQGWYYLLMNTPAMTIPIKNDIFKCTFTSDGQMSLYHYYSFEHLVQNSNVGYDSAPKNSIFF